MESHPKETEDFNEEMSKREGQPEIVMFDKEDQVVHLLGIY